MLKEDLIWQKNNMTKQFKLDAVQYYEDHKDLGVRGCRKSWHRIKHINKVAERLPGIR